MRSVGYRSRLLAAHSGALGAVSCVGVLLRFPPAGNAYYPRCIFYAAFHLQCPGCGGTRAVAALLHGHWMEAMRWNAMIVLLLPLVAAFLGVSYYRAVQSGPFHWPSVPARWLYAAATMVLLFAIARDIHPF